MDVKQSRFHAGERWKYRTRPGEEGSILTVVRVESYAKVGVVVHISLDGLRIKNPRAATGFAKTVAHIPMAEDALGKSVTTLVRSEPDLPSYEDGYREWKSAFDEGKAGVFEIPVAEAIAGMESALNQ